MRSQVRFATASVKCLALCVSNQSGWLAMAEREELARDYAVRQSLPEFPAARVSA